MKHNQFVRSGKDELTIKRRNALWWWLHWKVKWSKSEISRIFGVAHATVLHGLSQAQNNPEELAMFALVGKEDKVLEILKQK